MSEYCKMPGWDCDVIGCLRTAADGPLRRIHPKGKRAIWLCSEHCDPIERDGGGSDE